MSQAGVTYYIVDKSGNISFPVFGDINVNGKTCKEISSDIQNRLSAGGYLFDAVVNTKIMSFKVTVLGDVKNPGVQTYTGERLTVLEAIGRAGDLESSAKRENVLVVREENGKRVTYTIDLRDQHSIFASPAYYMQQNDLVYVQPNKSVRVKGSAGYLYLSIGATIVGMLASIASLAIALTK
jgi:polysaccharide export outer membrane protein